MIGIYGMPGIGKTTLAKDIYNKLLSDFVHSSYFLDIGETKRCKGIDHVQSHLIKDIQPMEHEVARADDGINLIKSRFKGKKILILLDDIDEQDQLNDLARERDWFGRGSIIIVTTRNKAILDESKFGVDYKHKVNKLDEVQSLLLFKKHAFGVEHRPRDFEDISHKIVSTMDGLPLALKMTGSYLYKKDLKVWQNVLNEQPEDVQKIFQRSYDALGGKQKKIFLDIACFFIGKESKLPSYMWVDCGFNARKGIEELELRCLIEIDEDGKLRMHGLLREFGRNIVEQEGPPETRSRLWLYEDAIKVLMIKKGTAKIEAICLQEYDDDLIWYQHLQTYTNEQFKYLQSLRFLQLGRAVLSGDFNNLFSGLRWLQWFDIEPNLFSSATNLHLSELVVLQLPYSKITEDWRGWSSIMVAKRLKVLDLSWCAYLRCTPDLSAFTELEILILKDCNGLEQLHPSIGKVKSLISLDLSGCRCLNELPGEVGELEELTELILDGAGITKIPTSVGSLRKLVKLSVSDCWSLREIPCSIGNLSSLQHLSLRNFRSLREIPNSIGNLSSLQYLNLKGCESLRELPSSIGNVYSLKYLNLEGCWSLGEIPSSIGNLSSLQHLNLRGCKSVREIPSSIGNLSPLQHLNLSGCRSLREIPSSIGDLQNLQHLDISNSAIEQLPSAIGGLKKLQSLILKVCHSLKREIPSEIGNLSSLEVLEITHAPIHYLPESIEKLSSLIHLNLWCCNKLQLLPKFPSSLTYLMVSCHSPRLPQLSHLINLKQLYLDECDLLEYIPELPSSPLKLCVDSCHKLVPKLDGFEYLEELLMVRCSSVKKLDLSQLNRLKRLHIEDCDDLVEIRSHHNLEFLEEIVIRYCRSIRRLILSKLQCLKQLKANYCDNLVDIQVLEKLDLKYLDISGCDSLEIIPELPETHIIRNSGARLMMFGMEILSCSDNDMINLIPY